MKRLFAFSVHDVKAAEETLQQKGLERHWTGGGTLNCVLQNKMHKLETQKKFKNTLGLRAVPLSSSPSSVAEKKRKKRKPLDASLFFQLFSSHAIRTKQKGDYITYKNFRTFLVKFRTCNYWTLNRISDKFRRR